jgi:hypothetical protein
MGKKSEAPDSEFDPLMVRMAMMLDEMDQAVVAQIESGQDSLAKIRQAISKVNFSKYFPRDQRGPKEQRDVAAQAIFNFFTRRRARLAKTLSKK